MGGYRQGGMEPALRWFRRHAFAWICLICAASRAFGTDIAILRNGFTIRHQHRETIGSSTRLYTTPDTSDYVDIPTGEIDHFEHEAPTTSPAASLPQVVNTASGRYHLDPDLVNSVIRAESGFNPTAKSPKGAQGLMQLMPGTASRLGVNDSFDPQANVDGGARYLRELLERYDFDLIKALAAYNAGPRRVEQYHGVPPYYETQAYVAKIVRDFNRKKLAERKAVKTAHKAIPSRSAPVKQAALPAATAGIR